MDVADLVRDVTFGTPGYWLDRLNSSLDARQRELANYDNYYCGRQPLVFAGKKFREAFGLMFRDLADNWCDLVVDAVVERLKVEGFRLERNSAGDSAAWDIWQRNQLDADSKVAHTEAVLNGIAYGLVWPDKDGLAEITVEHPRQVIVANAAGSRRQRAAGLKRWIDDTGYEFATLYLPDGIYKFQSRQKVQAGSTEARRTWVQRFVEGESWPLRNPGLGVPIVPLCNRPRLLVDGESEIRKVIPLQDAVNKLLADLLVAAEFGSFRQRWVTGMDIPVDPDTKQKVEPFKAAVDRIWMAENPNVKFGDFGETNLTNIVASVELVVQHIASQTRTPPHYFYLKGQFPSGESIKSAETGLVAKAIDKQLHFGEGWEEVLRLAFLIEDPARGDANGMETIWGDPESRTESEHIDALVKKVSLHVPYHQLWEDAGYTPQQIERFKQMLADEAANTVLNPPAPVMQPAPGAPTQQDQQQQQPPTN